MRTWLEPWLRRLFAAVLLLAGIVLILHAGEWVATHLKMTDTAAVARWLGAAIHEHQEVLVVFMMAVIACMPTELPSPFNQIPFFVWSWSWFSGSVRQFANMQHPGLVKSHSEQTEGPGGSRIVTDKISASIPSPAAEPVKSREAE